MNPISDNPKTVVDFAMNFELEGRKILHDAGEKSKDPLSKATFQFLADQELKHIEAIRAFAAALAKNSEFNTADLPTPLSKEESRKAIKDIFTQFKTKFEATSGKEEERQEVYYVAEDMEHRGHDFYHAAAEKTTDATARKLYKFLAEEEARHFEIIQETAEFLKQPDAIMAVEERWMQF